jgi:hypothetical protein
VPPIEMPGTLPGYPGEFLMEVVRGSTSVQPLAQIVFELPSGERTAHRVTERMRGAPDVLARELYDRGLERARPIHAIARQGDVPWVSELLTFLRGGAADPWEFMEVPSERVVLAATVRVTEEYFRAIAKIAFHYTLSAFPALSGEEREFQRVRDYIWAGQGAGHDRPVRQRASQFCLNFSRGERPRCWMHVLGVEKSYIYVVAHVQLFAGPNCMPLPYQVNIGTNPARIDTRLERQARVFALDPLDGFDGVMQETAVNTFVVPVGFTLAG